MWSTKTAPSWRFHPSRPRVRTMIRVGPLYLPCSELSSCTNMSLNVGSSRSTWRNSRIRLHRRTNWGSTILGRANKQTKKGSLPLRAKLRATDVWVRKRLNTERGTVAVSAACKPCGHMPPNSNLCFWDLDPGTPLNRSSLWWVACILVFLTLAAFLRL